MRVFWDTAPCILVKVNLCFGGVYCLNHQGDNESSKHLRNIKGFLQDYIAQHPRTQLSSFGVVVNDSNSCNEDRVSINDPKTSYFHKNTS
jgi:hypothetical protein